MCGEVNFEVNRNKDLKLHDLQVACTYNIDGCEWTGKLKELDHHMNEVFHSGESPSMIEASGG